MDSELSWVTLQLTVNQSVGPSVHPSVRPSVLASTSSVTLDPDFSWSYLRGWGHGASFLTGGRVYLVYSTLYWSLRHLTFWSLLYLTLYSTEPPQCVSCLCNYHQIARYRPQIKISKYTELFWKWYMGTRCFHYAFILCTLYSERMKI